ncbi:MAG TPA: FtsX-like permease family protein [Solirubrobacteraceae bacterium]|jgi:putative ABC transport system permease protein|nr:FtsX-like permease family protein [Solirubrobacteraceae bacterium]
MRPANALRLYRVRLRARIVQECLAVIGIAAGVALLFASQVAGTSLQSSVAQLSHGIVGNATLQLVARDPQGFPESTIQRVRRIPGVRAAAPVLEVSANAVGRRQSESVELIGADSSLSELGGSLVRRTALSPFGGIGAVVLPAPLAQTLGVTKFGQEVKLQVAGRTRYAPLYAQLHRRQIGSLTASPIALAPLSFVQEIDGLPARVSRILVVPERGSAVRVRAALRHLAAGRLDVEGADYDEALFAKAAAVSNQSTALFSAISALVGFLFAFNATLLTVPQRRRLIADLRRDGYTPLTVLAVLIVDGLVLGLFACALGLALGEELSIHLLRSQPAFFSLAFAVGSQRVVSLQSIVVAATGGMLAALVAVLSPLRDVLSRDPLAAIAVDQRSAGSRFAGRQAIAGLSGFAAATMLLLAVPDAAIPGMVLLVAALLLELPILLAATLALVKRLAGAIVSPVPHVAAMELSAARSRAVAIAATGAIAVFGGVAIQGAHRDLLAGLESSARATNASTGLWVAPAGAYNLLRTTPFAAVRQTSLERLPGVRAVLQYRGGLLNYGRRRALVIAPSSMSSRLLPPGQIVVGDPRKAEARVRAGGWLVVSQALASEQHLRLGEAFRLPSPEPTVFRVAALSTNIGWAPGAIVMNARDYARAWGSKDLSAYSVLLDRGASPARVAPEIERALGPGTGLAVLSAAQQIARQSTLDRGALARLSQIARLISVFAVLAMAAAMGAMVWQRRPRLAKLRLEGLGRAELWRTILLESLLLLGVGCLSGAIFGVYGQQLADRALSRTINFPIVYAVAPWTVVESLVLVTVTAVAILAVPGYLAASVPAMLALQD